MQIKCTQCGVGIDIAEDSGFLTCPYCDSRLYIESDQTVRHFYLKPEIRHEQLGGIISKELFERELKQPVLVVSAEASFIPFWLIRLKEGLLKFPAAELDNPELQKFEIPVGKLVPYESEIEKKSKVEMPHLSLDDLMKKPDVENVKSNIERSDLIHVPFYNVVYKYEGNDFQAMVDAGEGRMYSEKLPHGLSREKDAYFMTLFIILSLIYVVEAFAIPGFWLTILGFAITGVVAWYLVSKALEAKGY